MTGITYRVIRHGEFESYDLSEMTYKERQGLFKCLKRHELIGIINILIANEAEAKNDNGR